MKKMHFLLLFCSLILVDCGGKRTVKPTSKPTPSIANKPAPAPAQTPPVSTPAPTATPPSTSATPTPSATESATNPGGYYLDDGPDANPPKDIDNIADAIPKKEPLLARSNRPYKALGQTYTPMTISQNYKKRGIASWYGKRFHGKKTSSGETYDMYSMTAAHTILPLPSYAKVTNVTNGRSVIVRVNDRGPFKHERIIDLSYAAAYKLRLITHGSGMVEVEAIHPDQITSDATSVGATSLAASAESVKTSDPPAITPVTTDLPVVDTKPAEAIPPPVSINPVAADEKNTTIDVNSDSAINEYFIQAGAFKNEANAEALLKKIQGLDIEQNVGINRVYNNGLHRLKLGPYDTKQGAEQTAANIRERLNIPTIITNQ